MKNILTLTVLALASTITSAYNVGVDVSGLTPTSAFSCAKNLGYDKAIVRCYMEAWGNNPVSFILAPLSTHHTKTSY